MKTWSAVPHRKTFLNYLGKCCVNVFSKTVLYNLIDGRDVLRAKNALLEPYQTTMVKFFTKIVNS